MSEKFWDELIELLQATRNDAVMRTRKDEVLIEETDKRIELVKKLRLDSQITIVKGEKTK